MAPIAFGGRGGGRGFKSPGRGGRGADFDCLTEICLKSVSS